MSVDYAIINSNHCRFEPFSFAIVCIESKLNALSISGRQASQRED